MAGKFEHHKRLTFKEELEELLEKAGIEILVWGSSPRLCLFCAFGTKLLFQRLAVDPRSGRTRRHHIHENGLQKVVGRAAESAHKPAWFANPGLE